MNDALLLVRRLLGISNYGLPVGVGALCALGLMAIIRLAGRSLGVDTGPLTDDPGLWVLVGMPVGIAVAYLRDQRLVPDGTRAWINTHEAILDKAGVTGDERKAYWRKLAWRMMETFPDFPPVQDDAAKQSGRGKPSAARCLEKICEDAQ